MKSMTFKFEVTLKLIDNLSLIKSLNDKKNKSLIFLFSRRKNVRHFMKTNLFIERKGIFF